MKITCPQPLLAQALAIAGRAVSARSALPVLGNVLIRGDKDDTVTVAGTNLEVFTVVQFAGKVDDPGGITLPARLFGEIIGSLPPERVSLALVQRTMTVALQCGRYDFNVKGIDAADFPALPDLPESAQMFESVALKKMMVQATFAASSDESRPTLTGVEVSSHEGALQMAATDGFRLSLTTLPGVGAPGKMIIPARSLAEVERVAGMIKAEKITVAAKLERNTVSFVLPGAEMTAAIHCRVIDANFPNYRAIIPKGHTTRVVAEVAGLRKALKLALLFARDDYRITRLEISPGLDHQFIVRGKGDEYGDSTSEVDVSASGERIDIAVDGKLLDDALAHIDTPSVVMELSQPARPLTLRPLGEQERFLHVLMPMQPK